jgi:hypothetical protein
MTFIPIQSLKSNWQNVRCFAAVMRSDAAVRSAFEGQGILSWWWNIVLALHGKPAKAVRSLEDRCQCVADGFRFYGWLYRALAIIFGAAAFCCWVSHLAGFYWIAWLGTGGIYLWTVSGLAFSGATHHVRSNGEQIWHLIAFLFFVTLFLACVLISISIQVRLAGGVPDAANICLTLGLMALGVGSYLIELAALTAREVPQKVRVN